MSVKSEFEQLISEYMPNVSGDYIYALHLYSSYLFFHKITFLNYFNFFNIKKHYLLIEFTDGSYIKFRVNLKTKDLLKDRIDEINNYLKESR